MIFILRTNRELYAFEFVATLKKNSKARIILPRCLRDLSQKFARSALHFIDGFELYKLQLFLCDKRQTSKYRHLRKSR
jgi:hypothetical protein